MENLIMCLYRDNECNLFNEIKGVFDGIKDYYKSNKDKIKEQKKEYQEKNKSRITEYKKEYYSKKVNCPICSIEIHKASLKRTKKTDINKKLYLVLY